MLHRVLERIVALWALAGGLAVLAIGGLMVWNVVAATLDMAMRGWGPRVAGIYGAEDVVALLASVAALSFFPWCHLNGGHIAVGIVMDHAPAQVQRVSARLTHLLAAGSALFLGWWLGQGALEVWRDGTASGIRGWPQWPFYLPGVVSMLLWALVALRLAIEPGAAAREGHA